MTINGTIINPFCDQSIPSFAWLREQIFSAQNISPRESREMLSAINVLSKWLNLPLSMMPANAEFLRQKLKHIHPLQIGVSDRRFKNVKSLLLKCLREVGLTTKFMPYLAKMNSKWQGLHDALPGTYEKAAMSRLMRYCSNCDISPEDINDKILEGYLTDLTQETLVKGPRTHHKTVCQLWNKMALQIDQWPDIQVSIPCYDDRLYAVGDEFFAPDLLLAIEKYLSFLGNPNLFDGLKRPFRPRSIESVRHSIRRYLSALHHAGYDVSTLKTLDDITQFEVFKTAMGWFWERNGGQTSKGLGELAWAIRCIAIKHLKCDAELAEQYSDAIRKLKIPQVGLSQKNREMLRQFDDRSLVKRFLELPDLLWERATKAGFDQQGSLYCQSAIAIEILTFAPMRIANLHNLHLGRHINWINGRVHINIPEDEVKNREPLHFILPQHLSDRVKIYINDWRDLFFASANPFLFPGRNGGPKNSAVLGRQITRYSFKYAGIQITPHQFRHVAAKLLLDQKPGHYEVLRKLLGHKDLGTTYDHYAGAETQAAIELYDDVILDLKSDKPVRINEPHFDPLNPFMKGRRR
jgi:integrase